MNSAFIRQPTQPHSVIAKNNEELIQKNNKHPICILTKFESLVSSGAQKVTKEIEGRQTGRC